MAAHASGQGGCKGTRWKCVLSSQTTSVVSVLGGDRRASERERSVVEERVGEEEREEEGGEKGIGGKRCCKERGVCV